MICPFCGYKHELDDLFGCPNCLGEGLDDDPNCGGSKMRVCEQVKAKRMALGMSQTELSSGLQGFSDSTLSRYELGRMNIRLNTLKTIAQRLGTTVEEMEKVAASAGHSDPVKDGQLVNPVGERFATALRMSEFNEESLAKELGVKPPAILRWKADGVPRRRLALVAELLGISVAWLSEGLLTSADEDKDEIKKEKSLLKELEGDGWRLSRAGEQLLVKWDDPLEMTEEHRAFIVQHKDELLAEIDAATGSAVAIGGAKAKPEKELKEASSHGYVVKINDHPEAYDRCHSECRLLTREEAIIYLWALAKQDIPQYGVVWMPSGVEPMTNLSMFGAKPPAALRSRIQAQVDKLNETDIESIVCQGLNTIYDALGRHGDASDFVSQVTQAAKEWAEECLTDDNYLGRQQDGLGW